MRLWPRESLAGIEVGSSAVKFVRLRTGHRRVSIQQAGLVEYAEGDDREISRALATLVQEGGLQGQAVATVIWDRSLVARSVVLPKMPDDELAEAVRWEARKHLSFPVEEAVVDYLVTGEIHEGVADRLEVLFVGVPREAVLRLVRLLEGARLRVKAVDTNPLALRNACFLNMPTEADENTAIVDLGALRMEVAVFKGRHLKLSRTVEMGGEHLTRAIQEALHLGFQEAEALKRKLDVGPQASGGEMEAARAAVREVLDRMVLEVQRSLDFYKAQTREREIRRIVLTGGGALLKGIRQHMDMGPRLSTAMGLAMRPAA